MKIGDTIIIERLPSGLYRISGNRPSPLVGDGLPLELVGAAASTAFVLAREVFLDEAMEVATQTDPETASATRNA